MFLSTYGDTFILRVHWPALTIQTQVPPAMTLPGVVARHPWLDNAMRVIGYEPIQTLQSWNGSGILLGTAVHEVVKHLQMDPPKIIQYTDDGLLRIQKKKPDSQQQQQQASRIRVHDSSNNNSSNRAAVVTNHTVNDAPPPRYEQFVSTVPDIEMPPIPNRFEQLDTLSREELERLLADDVELKLFCNKLPIVQTYQKILTSVINENVVQAKKNLAKEEEIQELYKDVIRLQIQFKESVERFKELEKVQNDICQPPDMKVVIRELMKAKHDTMVETDRMADTWLENNRDGGGSSSSMDIDQFITQYVEKRKQHHLYAAKLELLQRGNVSAT